MKSKVTLKEIVATKIIYALLLACYYWMWARREGRIRKYSKEEKDELAIHNLLRADSIGLKVMTAATIVIAFACAVGAVSGTAAGYALVGMVFALAVIRFMIFCIMDSKGV